MPETLPHDIRPRGHRGDVLLPGRQVAAEDSGVAAVVEDEPSLRAGLGELRPVAQLAGPHAQVEAQAELAEQPDAADEFRLQAVAGGSARPVEDLADAP